MRSAPGRSDGCRCTHFVWLLLVVDEVFLHVQQRLVVVHVLGQLVIIWVPFQEGVGRCHRLLQVVELVTAEVRSSAF